jgi:hypothetical protein
MIQQSNIALRAEFEQIYRTQLEDANTKADMTRKELEITLQQANVCACLS